MRAPLPPTPHRAPEPAPALSAHVPERRLIEYTGSTALTVVGPLSGRRYRFERSGAVLEIDARDAAALAAVPNLRPARQPGR